MALTKWDLIGEAERAALDATPLARADGSSLPCPKCGEILPTEGAFARHFVLSDRRYPNLGDCPNKRAKGPRMRTADGVEIANGLRVINSDMRVGAVVLDDPRHKPEQENGEWWFYMIVDGHDRPTLVSESRVATRDPSTRAPIV